METKSKKVISVTVAVLLVLALSTVISGCGESDGRRYRYKEILRRIRRSVCRHYR